MCTNKLFLAKRRLFMTQPIDYLSIYLSICMYVCMYVYLPINPPIYISIYLTPTHEQYATQGQVLSGV